MKETVIKKILPFIILGSVTVATFTACSDQAGTKQAEFQVPDSDLRLTMTIANSPDAKAPAARKLKANDGNKELFAAQLDTNKISKAKLYKKQEQEYVLVDNNGDKYLLNFRDKQFQKSDPKQARSLAGNYIGKFDFDKDQNWRFIPSRQQASNEHVEGSTGNGNSTSNGTSKRTYGPPSKHF